MSMKRGATQIDLSKTGNGTSMNIIDFKLKYL